MTKAKINRAIKHLGIEVVGTRGDGYFYFIDPDGSTVGGSVMVRYLNHLTIEQWVAEAEEAVSE